MRRGAGVLILFLALAPRIAAQTPEPPGPFAIDVRGTMAGLPKSDAFVPAVPSQTVVPVRGFGLDAGAHVYPLRLRGLHLGVGGAVLWARGTAAPLTPTAPSQTVSGTSPASTPSVAIPDVATTLVSWSPQLSLNFGDRDGWSYLSAGAGRSRIRVVASSSAATAERVTEKIPTINVGGGARWWTWNHMAVTFDVRFHMLGRTTTTIPPSATASNGATATAATTTAATVTTPRVTLFVVSVGVSVR